MGVLIEPSKLSVFPERAILTGRAHEIPPRTHTTNQGRYRAVLILECGHRVEIDYRYVLSDSGASRARARTAAVALTLEMSFHCPACPELP